jgi:preprotein translocase subunit SecE
VANNETKNINKNTNKENAKDTLKGAPKNTPKKKPQGANVGNLWTRTRDYLTSVYNELKKVHWPDRRALVMYTVVVLIAVALVSGLLWLLDNIIGFLLDLVFKAFA